MDTFEKLYMNAKTAQESENSYLFFNEDTQTIDEAVGNIPVESRLFYPGGDAPRPEYEGNLMERSGQALADVGRTATSLAAGGAAGIATAIPDALALAGGVGRFLFPGDKGRAEAFVDTVTGISERFGSEFAINFATDLINKTDLSEDQRQMLADAFDVGTVAGLPFVPQAAKAVARGIRNYAAGAPERVAERATGTTLTSGIDPTKVVDDIITAQAKYFETGNYQPPTKENPVSVVKPTKDEPGIIAFHGSGADFDEFRVEMIGTGEGAQAFGYGLYFTDSKEIAKFYKTAVGHGNEVTYKGKTVADLDSDGVSYEENIAHMIGQQNNAKDQRRVFDNQYRSISNSLLGIEQAIKDYETNPTVYPLKFRSLALTMDDAQRIQKDFQEKLNALKEVEKNIDTIKTKPKGKIYKVKLSPNPNELLDYDVPIGQQNDFIITRLEKLVEEINLDDAMNLGFDAFELGEAQALQKAKENMLDPQRSVVSFLNDWAVFRGEQSTGEKLLDKYGIKGIKYKADQGVGARNVPETGKSNYVIFDDEAIKILEKYGIVGPVAVTTTAVGMKQEEQTNGNTS